MDYNFNQNNNNVNNDINHSNNIIDAVETPTGTYTEQRKARKKHPMAKKVGVFVLCGTLFGATAGAAFTGTTYLIHKNVPGIELSTTTQTATLTTATDNGIKATNTVNSTNSSSSMSVSDIATNCMPSIVAITNQGVTDVMTFWGKMQQQSESCGSGVIVGKTDKELLIVTNYHVIANSNTLTVVFSYDEDNEKPSAVEAYVKGYDEDRDLAVIAISADDLTDDMLNQLKIATIGSSSDLALGEQVVAIGNALGYGQSVTTGIVSALNRTISTSSDGTSTTDDNNKYIQTDTAINPGNSGGALFNMKGELVGINSAKIAADAVEGMGYAIPISDVFDLIQDLMNQTTRTEVIAEEKRGYLGISGSNVTSDISAAYGFPEGIFVSSVVEGSAADKAGIAKGNVITKYDGKSIRTISTLQNLLTYYKAGETVKVTIQVQNGSEYEEKEVDVTLSTAKEANITTTPSTDNSNNSKSYGNGNSDEYSDNDIYNFFGGMFR